MNIGSLPGHACALHALRSVANPAQAFPPFLEAWAWTLDLVWAPPAHDLLHGVHSAKRLHSQLTRETNKNFKIENVFLFWCAIPIFLFIISSDMGLPLQGCSLQFLDSVAYPLHAMPPKAAFCLIDLALVWVPPSQGSVQLLQGPNSFHKQFTVGKKRLYKTYLYYEEHVLIKKFNTLIK